MIRKIAILLRVLSILMLIAYVGWSARTGMAYAMRGDLYFYTDVARDFWLYDEIASKGVVLIGPRSSTSGLFHGPLWLYLTYPGYVLGAGDPAVMSWYWLFLLTGYLILGYLVVSKHFTRLVGLIFVSTQAGLLTLHSRMLFNPHGALFVMPFYFISLIVAHRTQSMRAAALNLFLAAVMIQFQLSIGLPFLILSCLYLAWSIFRKKSYPQFAIFLLLPLFVINFLIFDFRHGFSLSKAAAAFAQPNSSGEVFNYVSVGTNRLDHFLDFQFFEFDWTYTNKPFFALFFIFLIWLFWKKNPMDRDIVILFSYLYIGYYALSFINKGVLLQHQIFPLMGLTHLMLAIIFKSKLKIFASVFLILIFVSQLYSMQRYVSVAESFIGKDEDSWVFLKGLSTDLFSEDREFGYFVWSPDIVGYEPRYALNYYKKVLNRGGVQEYIKKPLVLVVAAPPSRESPHMRHEWWVSNKVLIDSKGKNLKEYENGYVVESYSLNSEELKRGFDNTIIVGTTYR